MFDKRKFFREVRTIVLIALFAFVLADINLFAKTNEQITSAASMEMAGSVGIYDENYDELADVRDIELQQIEANLENDSQSPYQRQFYLLDKGSDQVIATGDVSSRVREELDAQVNENMIVIGGWGCKVVDFNHYKLLVRVNTLSAYDEYVDAVTNYSLTALATLIVAIILVALGQKFAGKRESVRTGVNVVIILLVVGAFAVEALYAELQQVETICSSEQEAIQVDLEYLCNDSAISQYADKSGIETIGNSLASASVTQKEIVYVGPDSHLGDSSDENRLIASEDVQIVQDESKIDNAQSGFYIQAVLLLLLAFILANESRKRAKAKVEAQASGAADLTDDDRRARTIVMLVGASTACFGIVNVLRLRQVVMMNWTDNVGAIISAIFTAALIATIFASLLSSTILKRCGSMKRYVIAVCALGLVGSIACGVSDIVVVFVLGLILYNIAHTTTRMSGDFYTTTIDEKGRKDRCYVELDGARSIGDVVGAIAGGIISSVVSFAFVQIMVGALFLFILIYATRAKGESFNAPINKGADAGSIRDSLAGVAAAVKHPNVLLYMVCISMMGSITFMLIEYKLPLDIAALGLSTVILSFLKTLQDVVDIYSRPLFHVINSRIGPMAHAVLFVVFKGAVALVYMLSGGSLLIMSIAVCLLGLCDGAAGYAVTQAFRELPDLKEMPESDRIGALRLSQQAGNTVATPLLSTFQSGPILPVVVMVLPLLYFVKDKIVGAKEAR